jgi:20S proteasome subunit alpha 5
MEIDAHLGRAMSGLTADARTMVDHARVTAQNHAFTYDERIRVESATQAVCDLALRFGESIRDDDAMMSRPFGVALLIAGIDEDGPQLYVPPCSFVKQSMVCTKLCSFAGKVDRAILSAQSRYIPA